MKLKKKNYFNLAVQIEEDASGIFSVAYNARVVEDLDGDKVIATFRLLDLALATIKQTRILKESLFNS